MSWIRWSASIVILTVAAYHLFTSGFVFDFYERIYKWTFDADGANLSDDLLRDMWVNTIFSILQVGFTTIVITLLFSRKEKKEEARAKKYLASSLRDELFEYVVSPDLSEKMKHLNRIEMICDRAEASMQKHEWSVADRFRDALKEHHSDPGNQYSKAILEIRFRNLAERLCIAGSELEAFCDRIAVAFTYRTGTAL